jgi:hypothetical protein
VLVKREKRLGDYIFIFLQILEYEIFSFSPLISDRRSLPKALSLLNARLSLCAGELDF